MGYVIISDSTCDLSPEVQKELDVKFMPLSFRIENKEYKNYFDEREMKLKKFYELLKAGSVATTSQLNIIDIENYFRKYLLKNQDIMYICFSSGLSGTFNAARLAKQELEEEFPLRKIEVIDSLSASSGEGLLVYQAHVNRKAGMSMRDNVSFCETYRYRIKHWFTVDDIDTLKRGGRLTPSKAFLAKILNIKPILNVDNAGHLQAVSKKSGRKAALRQLVANTMADIELDETFPTFVTHAECIEDAQIVKAMLEEEYKARGINSPIYITKIGPVIGAHSGPGTLAVFTVGSER